MQPWPDRPQTRVWDARTSTVLSTHLLDADGAALRDQRIETAGAVLVARYRFGLPKDAPAGFAAPMYTAADVDRRRTPDMCAELTTMRRAIPHRIKETGCDEAGSAPPA